MTETSHLPRAWDHIGTIRQTLGNLHGSATVVNELVQNADDAPNATQMRFTVTEDALEVWNDGTFAKCSDVSTAECEWLVSRSHRCDFHSFRLVASGDKANRADTTGAFGIGFTSVYQLTDHPELISNGEHWVLDELAPEAERIERSDAAAGHAGTTFRLPWATELSDFRQKVNQEAVAPEQIDGFPSVLLEAVPAAMVFLRHLRSVTVEGPNFACTFDREVDDDQVTITSSTGGSTRYLLLVEDYTDEAEELKALHPTVIDEDRGAIATVAIPIGSDHGPGLLYATLPTEELTHLPLLINASFIPASDRKRVRFDAAPAGDWNRQAIRSAGAAIGRGLERICKALGNEGFAEFLLQASKIDEATGDRDDEFGSIWDAIDDRLPTAAVVPAEGGSFGTVGAVRLWNAPLEIAAAEELRSIGIELVASSVRNIWFQLRGATGIQDLRLGDVNRGLDRVGAMSSDRPCVPKCLESETAQRRLWAVIDVLLSVTTRSGAQTTESLKSAWIVPGNDGQLWRLVDLFRAEQVTQDLFDDLGTSIVFVDETRLDGFTNLTALADGFELPSAVAALEGLDREGRTIPAQLAPDLLGWLAERARSLTDSLITRLVRLPIFPAASGLDRLEDMALPGVFRDELGLAKLVAIDGIERLRPFLKDGLGCPELTFSSYCTDHVAPAIRADEVDAERRQGFVRTLTRQLSSVQGETELRDTMRGLELVLCDDGSWRKGDQTYLNAEVREMVGSGVAVAADDPDSNPEARLSMLRWLGAQSIPRPSDVRERCKQLVTGGSGHVRAAMAIIGHVAELHAKDAAATAIKYDFLRTMRWLPPEGHLPKGVAPDEVYVSFERYLFVSQARFLGLELTFQRNYAAFFQWLGVRSSPTPAQVVAHLLHEAAAGAAVSRGVWIYLSQNAADPALDALTKAPCIYIEARQMYVRPEQVFWGHHPFGRHRYVLGPDFAEFHPLFDRLGVPESPRPSDAVEVLLDIGSEWMGESAALLEDDVRVVHACWELLSHGIAEGESTGELFDELRNAEVVLDRDDRLRRPEDVFFSDSERLASLFGARVQSRLIERHESTWRALAAAGVAVLSESVDTRITEQEPLTFASRVEPLLTERRDQLVRLLSPSDDRALQKVDSFFDGFNLAPLSQLEVQQAISIDGDDEVSEVHDRRALCHREDSIFFWVEPTHGALPWSEIGRELMRAIGIEADSASGATMATRTVLSAGSVEEAEAELDDAGYPRIELRSQQEAEPAVADGAIGVDTADEVEPASEEQPDVADPAGEGDARSHSDEEHRAPGADEREVDGGSPSEQAVPTSQEGVGTPADPEDRDPVRYVDVDDDESDDDPDSFDDGVSDEGGRPASVGGGGKRSKRSAAKSAGGKQTQLISYVNPPSSGIQREGERERSKADERVEQAGVDAVVAYEQERGRTVEVMPPGNEGYDLLSTSEDGLARFIEVKSTASEWGKRGVRLSSAQFAKAQQERERFWLYVVEDAMGRALVHPIQDPASIIDMFVFDKGWRAISQRQVDQPAPQPLPVLHLPSEHTQVRAPVQVVAIDDGGVHSPLGWVPSGDPDRRSDWFGVQIEGRSLGQPAWGGIALFAPANAVPEDCDDPLLFRLGGQTDPDTGTNRTIRRWSPVFGERGEQIAVRLDSDGPVPPLTLKDPSQVEVLGILQGVIPAVDLEEFIQHPTSTSH